MSLYHCCLCCVLGDCRSLPRHDSKDRDGQSSPAASRKGRSSVSPTMMLTGGGKATPTLQGHMEEEELSSGLHVKRMTCSGDQQVNYRCALSLLSAESKSICKLGRSASTSGVPPPGGMPQHHLHEMHHPALSQVQHHLSMCVYLFVYCQSVCSFRTLDPLLR